MATKKVEPTKSKIYSGPCTVNMKKVCPGMQYALDYRNARDEGITKCITYSLKTGEATGSSYVYRTTKGNKLMMMRFCPWCGTDFVKVKSVKVNK